MSIITATIEGGVGLQMYLDANGEFSIDPRNAYDYVSAIATEQAYRQAVNRHPTTYKIEIVPPLPHAPETPTLQTIGEAIARQLRIYTSGYRQRRYFTAKHEWSSNPHDAHIWTEFSAEWIAAIHAASRTTNNHASAEQVLQTPTLQFERREEMRPVMVQKTEVYIEYTEFNALIEKHIRQKYGAAIDHHTITARVCDPDNGTEATDYAVAITIERID